MYHECIAMWACSFKCKIVRNYVEAWYWYIYIRKSTRIHAQSCTVVLCACTCQIVRLWASTWFNLVKWDIVGSSDQLDKHIACARTHTFIYIYYMIYNMHTHAKDMYDMHILTHNVYFFYSSTTYLKHRPMELALSRCNSSPENLPHFADQSKNILPRCR